jgi:hypothetical protein
MRYKQKLFLLLFLSIVVAGISFIFLAPDRIGLCLGTDDACVYKYTDYEKFTAPSLLFSIVTFFISLILLFLHESIFYVWLKFAVFWIIISALLISKSSNYSSGWGLVFPSESEFLTMALPGLFLLISLILIFWKSRKNRA